MARLIDTKALMKRIDRYPPYISDTVRKVLRYVPTVDAVEVVRCKDCKFYATGWCKKWLEWSDDDNGFCSWGERREDETD